MLRAPTPHREREQPVVGRIEFSPAIQRGALGHFSLGQSTHTHLRDVVRLMHDLLDGKDRGAGSYGDPELERLRRRILELRAKVDSLETDIEDVGTLYDLAVADIEERDCAEDEIAALAEEYAEAWRIAAGGGKAVDGGLSHC